MEKALKALVAGEGLRASMWEEEWLDVVYPWEILRANKIIMDSWEHSKIAKTATLESNVTISGTVHIEDNVVIKAGAVLEGPCSIGKNCYIGNNSLIRSYTALEDNCSVGYGVELKNCVVQKNSHIGRLSFIGDSVLGGKRGHRRGHDDRQPAVGLEHHQGQASAQDHRHGYSETGFVYRG